MRKILISFLFCCLVAGTMAQSSDDDGIYISFSILANRPNRPDMEKYIKVLDDSLGLNPGFKASNGIGAAVSILFRTNKTEFDLGGYASKGGYSTAMSNLDPKPRIGCSDIELHLGMNYFPVPWFLMGAHFATVAEQNNTLKDYTSAAISSFDEDVNLNIFRGYSVGVKGIAGLNIPLNSSRSGYFRITPYYYFGLSKYNYYKSFDNVLTSYSGSKKTAIRDKGLTLGLVLAINKP